VRPLGCGRYRIQPAVSLLDPSGTEMALHCDADVVRAIVGARQVKFLSGPADSQGQDALAQTRRAGFASHRLARACSWRPPAASARSGGPCFCGGSRCGPPSGWCLADARQNALGRLEIGQPSGDRCPFGIEACKPLADLRLLRADLVQYRRCCARHGGLQWFQVDQNDRSCWRLTPQREIFNHRMRRQASLAADPDSRLCAKSRKPRRSWFCCICWCWKTRGYCNGCRAWLTMFTFHCARIG